jgi:hypothetical protein
MTVTFLKLSAELASYYQVPPFAAACASATAICASEGSAEASAVAHSEDFLFIIG